MSIFEDIRDAILRKTPTFYEGDLSLEEEEEDEAQTEAASDQGIDQYGALQNILSEIQRAKKEGRDITHILSAATEMLEEINV